MVALLLLGVIIFNPKPSEVAEAVSVGELTEVSDEEVVQATNADEGIMRLAPQPTISMDISSDTNDGYGNDVAAPVETAPGAGTAYRSHKVTVSGSNIMTYSLSISGPTNLTPSSGASTVVSGAEGKTGAEMSTSSENIWGYAWGQVDDKVADMPYNTMQDGGTSLECDNPNTTDYSVSCERKLVFGANFSSSANAGTYTAPVTLSLTSTPAEVTYSLVYNANGGANPPTAETRDSVADSEQFTISDKGSMTRAGYEFLGWSSSANNVADASLAPGQTITIEKANRTKILYAAWKAITLDAITTMQEMLPAVCSNAANGATKTLTDTRDNNSYTIVKYGGRCWMQQNLRLTGGRTLTPADSDVTSNWSMPATLNGSGTSVSGWTNSATEPRSISFGNTADSTNGVYYNWVAATAGTGGSGSVCPKGWKLPTNTEYSSMLQSEGIADSSAGSTKIRGTPYNFVHAGHVNGGTLDSAGSSGYYWSRTADDARNAYNLLFGSSRVLVSSYGRSSGFSVRCVAAQ